MKPRILMTALTVLLVMGTAGAFAADTLESVEKQIMEKWSEIKSLTAKTSMDMSMQGMSMTSEGTMEYATRDGKELFRTEMTMKQNMGGQTMDTSMCMVADGEFVYNLTEMMGQKRVMKHKADAFPSAVGGRKMFEDLKQNHDLKLLPDETLDGRAMFVIEAKAKGGAAPQYETSKMFFAKDLGIMVKMVGLDAEGKEVMTMKVTDIKPNANIDPKRFKFEVPEGVEVMDMTAQ